MRNSLFKRFSALLLVLCLALAMLPMNAAAASETYNFSGTLVGLNATNTYSMTLEEDALVTINNHGSLQTKVMLHKPGTNWMTDYIGGDGSYQLKAGTYCLTAYVHASAVVESEFYYAFSVTISTHTCSYKKDKVVSPTCSARGYTLYVCSCGKTKKSNYVDQLPHDECNSAEVPATCQKTGRTAGIYCTVCGATISGRDTIPKTDHTYVNNVCTYCGQLTGICGDDLQWTLDPDGKLTVIGTGDMYSYEMGGSPWKEYTDRITSVSLPNGLTSIGSFAFQCLEVSGITIPNSVTRLDMFAFSGCTALTAVTIPESVTSIGDSAFADCSALTQIQIPASVTSVGELAFSGCTGLTRIDIVGDAPAVGTNAFDGVTAMIHYHAAADGWEDVVTQNYGGNIVWDSEAHTLEKVQVIKPTCTEQGYTVYTCICGMQKLDEYTDPKHSFNSDRICSVCKIVGLAGWVGNKQTIWTYDVETATLTFSGGTALQDPYIKSCSSLANVVKRVVIEEGITSICSEAFKNFSALEEVEATGVNYVGSYAFYNCTALREFTGNVTQVNDHAFSGCTNLRNIALSDAATFIDRYAFAYCYNLESIQLSSNLKNIKEYAFACCYNLKEITIPDTVTYIGDGAFTCCESLTELILPSSLEGWGADAFDKCTNLRMITFNTHLTASTNANSFTSCNNLSDVFFTSSAPSYNGDWFLSTSAIGYYSPSQSGWKEFIDRYDTLESLPLVAYNPCSTHSFGEWTETAAPTCSSVGVETRTCSGCEYYRTRAIDKTSHSWDDGVVTKEPTETSTGLLKLTCTVCNANETQTIPKLEHTHTFESTVIEPTCIAPGYTLHTCTCGYSYTDTEVPATEHSFGEWGTVTAPTCTKIGSEERACTVCSHAETRQIPKTDHTEEIDEGKSPSCTEPGMTEGSHCSICNAVLVPQEPVPATGHRGGMATCVQGALCEVCGVAYCEKDPANHTGETEIRNRVEASEFADGYSGDVHCKGCGELLEKGNVIPATHIHSFAAEWSTDSGNHWHGCACGEKTDLAAHVPGAEPTETSPQVCTICGWELKPAIVHTHKPEKVEFMDATHEADGYEEHYACECGVLFADAEGTEVITEEDIRIARYELGDVDHDHRLTSMDAMLLMQYKAGLLPVDFAFCTECADVDGKMGINSMDAMLILQFRAGLIESFR